MSLFYKLNYVRRKIAVFWVVAPCSLVEVYQRFKFHFKLRSCTGYGRTRTKTKIILQLKDKLPIPYQISPKSIKCIGT
jgi:hypothetical protein